MAKSTGLVAELQQLFKEVERDLMTRCDEPDLEWAQHLRRECDTARARQRTALTWTDWRSAEISHDRLEAPDLWRDGMGPRIRSVASLPQQVKHDDEVMSALPTLTRVHDPDVAEEAVPFLAAYRYKESGMGKRAE